MRIAIGCDHGAFALKNKVIEHLEKQGLRLFSLTHRVHSQ